MSGLCAWKSTLWTVGRELVKLFLNTNSFKDLRGVVNIVRYFPRTLFRRLNYLMIRVAPTCIAIGWIWDSCNDFTLSNAWFFCDTIIRYHQTTIVAFTAMYLNRPQFYEDCVFGYRGNQNNQKYIFFKPIIPSISVFQHSPLEAEGEAPEFLPTISTFGQKWCNKIYFRTCQPSGRSKNFLVQPKNVTFYSMQSNRKTR